MTPDLEPTLAERFRRHFSGERHLYWHLARGMADDIEAGGVTAAIVDGWETAPAGAVVQLRLLAGLFREVLQGRADELLPFYPCLGGLADPAGAWPIARDVMARSVPRLRAGLNIAPQTNEPGRSAALLVGLCAAVRRSGLHRVRLLELGASAGLNLLVDGYRFEGDGWDVGPVNAPCRIADIGARGLQLERFEIVQRRGCDIAPVDATSAEGAVWLRSFVWPFMIERHERLDGALAVAARTAVTVDRASAASWLDAHLARADDAVLTVVWQSITRQYWPVEEVAAVAALLDQARGHLPLAHVAMESPEGAFDRVVDHSGGLPVVTLDGQPIARCDYHGPPVTLTD